MSMVIYENRVLVIIGVKVLNVKKNKQEPADYLTVDMKKKSWQCNAVYFFSAEFLCKSCLS